MTEKTATLINLNRKLQANLREMNITICKRLDFIWLENNLPKTRADHPLFNETYELLKKIIKLKFGDNWLKKS